MYAYIPSNLDLSSERHMDKYYFIITFIFFGRIFDKRKNSTSFIQLYSLFLKSVLSGHYRDYLQDLMEMKVIETDNRYIQKEKSKAYRLTENYRSRKTKQIIIEDKKIISNYWNYKAELKKNISESHYKYLYECLEQIEIDYETAKTVLNQTDCDFEQYSSWNCSIDMIYSKDWFFVVDKTAGRVHNNVTNLSKNFRPFLIFNNQKLVEIDVKNAQPLLFNLLINRYLLRYTDYSGNILPYVPQDSDIRFYRELTENGKFYEYIMKLLGVKEERGLFKVRFFSKVFYSKECENEERSRFKVAFPEVSEIISYYKKVNHKDLAIELQKIEAEIMIHSVVKRLMDKKIFVLTIHDSILTTQDNVELVKQVMMNEFKKYNLQPTLKVKN